MVLVALQKLACAHGEVASLLDGSAGHHVGNDDAAVVVALRENVVRVVRPGVDFDLVVRVDRINRQLIQARTRGSACSSRLTTFGTRTRCLGLRIHAPPLRRGVG